MRWQEQTLMGDCNAPPEKQGDCLRACIASILDVPSGSLPNPAGDAWRHMWNNALEPLGYCMVEVNIGHSYPRGLWIATVQSLSMAGHLHSVVTRGRNLVFDPTLGTKYTDESWVAGAVICGGMVLVPLDPVISRGIHGAVLHD